MTREITKFDNTIDIRDVIARVEELDGEIDADGEEQSDDRADAVAELELLTALLDECKGNGGDEQWRGDWYPVTLIRDSYFREYAMELADDIGAVKDTAEWPHNCIDWDRAAHELRMDYTSVEFDGVTYWTR